MLPVFTNISTLKEGYINKLLWLYYTKILLLQLYEEINSLEIPLGRISHNNTDQEEAM